ncbi:SpoIIE family protein phosphatase [Streptomyces sp. B1I3]|uniref:SpoIIE family protein phosphatase n=1 Tax=Streptomyces sp. B1I3 TaxID=3042264 RepID=UPI0027844F99|nr:SpoIIE family protein phosphatase [Streptomyces sp. B1I3]MDQ0792134.1 serine phosphatase RsbU (regulator of sigma subunit) [Streptomyces sp. B1I3]
MHRFGQRDSGPGPGREPPVAAHVALAVNGMGSFTWDLPSGTMRYDEAGLAVMGFRPGEYDGSLRTLGERMVPGELSAVQDQVERALRTRSGFSLYFRVRHGDGRLRWTHTQGHVVCDEQDNPVRVIGIIRDASQELRALDQTEQLRQARDDRRRQADIVGHVSDALAPTVTVEDVADALTTTLLLEQLGAASIILGLVDNGRMRLAGSNGVHPDLIRDVHLARLGAHLPLTDAARTRRAVFITSRKEYGARYPEMQPYLHMFSDATAAVYLPLIAHDDAIGALGLTYDGKAPFAHDERTVLTALGKVIAQSLQRALLYDREHELAAGLQTAMLPGHLPHVPGLALATRYRPARAQGGIGGDWYDALALPDGRIAAVVGDVQGHDVTAAAVMGQLRIALRAYAAEGHPPTTVVARASAFLAELDTDRFATCLFALLDPTTGMTVFVRAGHLDPVLRRPDGSTVWLDAPGGLPLGLTAPAAQPGYPALETVLEPGATLLMCTDGLIESRTEDIDQGRARLLDALRTGPGDPDALADHLLRTMGAHTGGEDDVALLVLRRSPGERATNPQMEVTITPTDAGSLRAARKALRAALGRWSLDAIADTAELLACELATNALLHTRGSATLTARLVSEDGRAVRLAVTDTSTSSPRRRAATEQSTSGRGLMLLEELATTWGVEPRGDGKTVWCEISVTGAR